MHVNVEIVSFQEVDEYSSLFPIEIGGYQIKDNLVEFDLEASKFYFTFFSFASQHIM